MFCVCGKEITSTVIGPWISCVMDSYGKVTSGTCLHGKFFSFMEKTTYKEYVDHMKEVTPKKNQI